MKNRFIIWDNYNGYLVYSGNDRYAARKAYCAYDRDCEGDWIPFFEGEDL